MKIQFYLVAACCISIMTPTAYAKMDQIEKIDDSRLYWNGENVVFAVGNSRTVLQGATEKSEANLFPTGDKVIYIDHFDGVSQIFVYDGKRDRTFNVIPHFNFDAEIGFLNPTKNDLGNLLKVDLDYDQRQEVIIYDLGHLGKFLDKSPKQLEYSRAITFDGEMDDGEIYLYVSSLFPEKTTMREKSIEDFKWLEDDNFSFQTPIDIPSISDPADYTYKLWSADFNDKSTPILMGSTPPSPWPDVAPDDPDYALLLKWRNEGIIPFQGSGPLGLDGVLTRRDVVEFNYPIELPSLSADKKWPCLDMKGDDRLASKFMRAFGQGLQVVDAKDGLGLCAPDKPVTRLEVVSMIFSGFEYEPAKIDCQDRWPDYGDPMLPNAPYAALAKSNNLFGEEAERLDPTKPMTKREAIRLEESVVEKTIIGYNSPRFDIPCDIVKYAKEYTWDKDSAVSKLLRRREMTKKIAVWGGTALGVLFILGGGVWVWKRKK